MQLGEPAGQCLRAAQQRLPGLRILLGEPARRAGERLGDSLERGHAHRYCGRQVGGVHPGAGLPDGSDQLGSGVGQAAGQRQHPVGGAIGLSGALLQLGLVGGEPAGEPARSLGELAYPGHQLLLLVERVESLVDQLVHPADVLLHPVGQFAGAVGELAEILRHGGGLDRHPVQPVGQLVGSVGQLDGAVRGLLDAVGELFGAVGQFGGTVCHGDEVLAHLVEAEVDLIEVGAGEGLVEGGGGGVGDHLAEGGVGYPRDRRGLDADRCPARVAGRTGVGGGGGGELGGDGDHGGVASAGQAGAGVRLGGLLPGEVLHPVGVDQCGGQLAAQRDVLVVDGDRLVEVDDGRLDLARVAVPGGGEETARHQHRDQDQPQPGGPAPGLGVVAFDDHRSAPAVARCGVRCSVR